MVQLTLVLRHYVKHCRLTNQASIQVREAAGELAGVTAVALCLPGVAAPYRRATQQFQTDGGESLKLSPGGSVRFGSKFLKFACDGSGLLRGTASNPSPHSRTKLKNSSIAPALNSTCSPLHLCNRGYDDAAQVFEQPSNDARSSKIKFATRGPPMKFFRFLYECRQNHSSSDFIPHCRLSTRQKPLEAAAQSFAHGILGNVVHEASGDRKRQAVENVSTPHFPVLIAKGST